MKTIKHIGLSFLLAISLTASYGQNADSRVSQESMVILSEDNIVSLTKKLRAYKKKKALIVTDNSQQLSTTLLSQETSDFELDYLKNQIAQLENQLNEKKNNTQNNNAGLQTNSSNLDSRELRNLKYEVNQLRLAIKELSGNTKNEVIVLPSSNNSLPTQQQKEVIIREQVTANTGNDKIVQQKLDSLYRALNTIKQSENPNYSGDFDAMQKRMQELRNEIAERKAQPTTYEMLVTKYKNYKDDIYFADNSKILNTEALQIIEQLYTILDNNENLDVVVKGFASNKGNALYNENLSMQRTEAVKKALMLRGVHPTRVLTQYHGIDYSAKDANKARRVEISLLVRK